MQRTRLLALSALFAVGLLAGCSSDKPDPYPVILQYWRPIANPNLLMDNSLAQRKLRFDLAQCRCGSYPTNVPHHEQAAIAPDMGRLAETSSSHVDAPYGEPPSACVESPNAVVVECMRTRGWEPTSCSGRLPTAGGTQCALTVIGKEAPYPEDYPYRGTRDTSFDGDTTSPALKRQNYP